MLAGCLSGSRARARAPADSAIQLRPPESWHQELSNAGPAAF